VQEYCKLSEYAFVKYRNDVSSCYDVFCRHDIDGSGTLTKVELMFMLQESGLAPRSPHEKEDMSVIFDEHEHHDNVQLAPEEIDFNDFLEIVYEIRHYRKEKAKEEQAERFLKYDRGGDMMLTISEVSAVLADSGLTPANRVEQEEIANLIASVDQDGSGYIDFEEFQELSQRIDEKLRSFRYEEEIEFAMRLGFSEQQMRDLRQVFSSLDQDCSQKLDADEVRIGLAMMNKHVTHKVFDETFRSLDSDGSGELDFMEFLEFMKMIVDQQGPLGNQEDVQKLAQKPKDLEIRILRRVLEYFRLAKNYINSLNQHELVNLFCEFMCVKPEADLHRVLDVKTVGELYELAQQRDIELQNDSG
jgi:Ca2+-binding EF-hand superfamily protein